MLNLKSYSANSHQGPYLQINEDAVEVDLINKLFIILDGFGGSGIGDQAVKELKSNIKNFYTKIGGDPDATLPFFYSHKYLIEGNALINSMNFAHDILKKSNMTKEMGNRAGASAIAVAQAENILTIASTGSCEAYLLRKGNLSRICVPDNYEFLVKDDYEKQFYTSPLSAFGLFENLHLNIQEVRINSGDLVILLTDGAYGRIQSDELRHILQEEQKSNGDKIESLFSLANSRGNLDNQSALLLQY